MIALGCDHGGYELMQEVIKYLEEHGLEYKNYGTYSTDSCDYPDYAKKVAEAILAGECEKGILICGTGIGITIAANRYEGIRAANCTNSFMAEATREHKMQYSWYGSTCHWCGHCIEDCGYIPEYTIFQ